MAFLAHFWSNRGCAGLEQPASGCRSAVLASEPKTPVFCAAEITVDSGDCFPHIFLGPVNGFKGKITGKPHISMGKSMVSGSDFPQQTNPMNQRMGLFHMSGLGLKNNNCIYGIH
jgi:hypothetical protein